MTRQSVLVGCRGGFRILEVCVAGAGLWPGFAALGDHRAGDGYNSERRGAYAAIMAAISGRMPMILMTRLRL
jgi:hypothetical protein